VKGEKGNFPKLWGSRIPNCKPGGTIIRTSRDNDSSGAEEAAPRRGAATAGEEERRNANRDGAGVGGPSAGPSGAEKGFTLSVEDDAALRLWVTLARSYQTFTRVVSSRVVEYGLTIPQFGILEALYHLGPLSLGELAEKLLVTGGNVTYVMDRLEEQGLVYRQRSDLDRRVVEARLTDEGRALIERIFPDHARFLGRMVEHLGPVEQRELRELLKRLGKGLASRTPELTEPPELVGVDRRDLSEAAPPDPTPAEFPRKRTGT